MGNEEELMRVARKLEKITNRKDISSAAQAIDLLKILQQTKITLDQIQKTRIGLIVNNLRKTIQDSEVSTLSKSLLKAWKKLLDAKDGTNGTKKDNPKDDSNYNGMTVESPGITGDNDNNTAGSSSTLSNDNDCTNFKTNYNDNNVSSSSFSSQQKRSLPLPKQSSFPASNTTDKIRIKCRELLANAMKPDGELEESSETFYDPVELANQIEEAIYREFKDTNFKYKSRIRSRVANLGDKKNPDLKLNVLRGVIKPDRIAVMTAEEMASNEMKELRQKFTKEAINDAQMTLTGGTKTDLLKCPACKKKNCTYNQVQTRSADEPMTTFCYCNECGKRWKFC